MFNFLSTLTKVAFFLVTAAVYLTWLTSESDGESESREVPTSFELVLDQSGRVQENCKVYPTPAEESEPVGWLSRNTSVIVKDNGGDWLQLLAPGGMRYLDRSEFVPWNEIKKYEKLYVRKSTFTSEFMTRHLPLAAPYVEYPTPECQLDNHSPVELIGSVFVEIQNPERRRAAF